MDVVALQFLGEECRHEAVPRRSGSTHEQMGPRRDHPDRIPVHGCVHSWIVFRRTFALMPPEDNDDPIMVGFHLMKGLIALYGVENTAHLLALADRLIDRG